MRVPNGFKIDEAAWALVQGLISYWGITSADGNAGGTTLVCDNLANEPSYANHAAKILTGPAAGQVRDIDTHPAGTNTVTVSAAFSNVTGAVQQITAGTSFVILSHSPSTAEVAALEAMVTALMADIDTLLSRLTAARAGYMDNLIAEISVVGSPYSQPNDVVEHDAIVVAAATQLVDIEIDVDALTQSNTIREYVQIDGANYRLITSKIYPTDFDPGVKAIVLSFPQKGQLYKITMQANVAEGAVRDVPYRIMTRGLN